jgi:hypothetical protein
MAWRVLVGMLKGLALGAALAAALVAGLGLVQFGPWLWAPAACGTGLLTGLLVGKPVWAPEAKVEAGLKALAGALLAAGGLLAVRAWLALPVDLSALGAGQGLVGDLPAASLPLLAAALGAWFEADNTTARRAKSKRHRVEAAGDRDEAVSRAPDMATEANARRHDRATRG